MSFSVCKSHKSKSFVTKSQMERAVKIYNMAKILRPDANQMMQDEPVPVDGNLHLK